MKLTQITLSLLTILMLSACGGSDSGTTTGNTTPTDVNGTSTTSTDSNEDNTVSDNTNNDPNDSTQTEDNTNNEIDTTTQTGDTQDTTNLANTNIWEVSNVSEFRQALLDASENKANDIIKLSAGTYNTNSDGLKTFSFDDTEEHNLTITAADGLSSKDVILRGNNENQVFNFSNSKTSTLIVQNISIKDGNTTISGGGIYSNQNMIIENSTLSNNKVHRFADGGAIYAEYYVKVINSEFLDNYARSSAGALHATTTSINDSSFSNNSTNGSAGAIRSSTTLITNSTFSNNTSKFGSGGAILSTSVNIKNSDFTNNSANFGGALSLGVKKSTIVNCTFSHNHSNVQVGAIRGAFYLILVNSVFYKNTDKSKKYTIASGFTTASNNLFIENEGAVSGYGAYINNIFLKNNHNLALTGNSKVYNNYIDFTKIYDRGNVVTKKNNLQPSDIGDVLLANDNMSLTSNSPVINQGLNPSSNAYREIMKDEIIKTDNEYKIIKELLLRDKIGNNRVHGATIDMGAIEFGSSK